MAASSPWYHSRRSILLTQTYDQTQMIIEHLYHPNAVLPLKVASLALHHPQVSGLPITLAVVATDKDQLGSIPYHLRSRLKRKQTMRTCPR
jgi:hypothetical protein